MQYHAIPCNTMQYHGTLITADGAYHCPVGSIMAIFFLSIIEIYLSNIHHQELNTNKSINRKIPIILTAKFNRIMLKEIFAPLSCLSITSVRKRKRNVLNLAFKDVVHAAGSIDQRLKNLLLKKV